MAIEEKLKGQSTLLNLLKAAGVKSKDIPAHEAVLGTDAIYMLVTSRDMGPAEQKLVGGRASLTPEQSTAVTLVKYLLVFDEVMGSWLGAGTEPYATEHVMQRWDVGRKQFADKGTHADLASRVTFGEFQVLRQYSAFADQIAQTFKRYTSSKTINFGRSADEVAKLLVGRSLLLPSGKLVGKGVRAWEDFLKNPSKSGYDPKVALIVETEGFETHQGVTKMRYCMLAPAGQFDVMLNRGHALSNIGTGAAEQASCVMLRTVLINGKDIYEGPGRVGKELNAEGLVGKYVDVDVPLIGQTLPSGIVPAGAQFSTGGYRLQANPKDK